MTAPSLPPPVPLNLPEPAYGYRRPPSPLRNGTTIDLTTGEISDDGSIDASEESDSRQWTRSHSPSPSVAKFAANFAQRVGSLVNSMSSRGGLPTDEELEAEAERERERSRREAERILEQERLTVEERVLAMLQTQGDTAKSLPNPPSRAQTMPATPESPSSAQKEQSWWAVAKSRLTPTKEPLTPAQQIIQDTKAREKETEKEKRKSSKISRKSNEWPSASEGKFEDPAFIQLGRAAAGAPPPSRPISAAPSAVPSSPSSRPIGVFGTPPSLAASPLRTNEGTSASPSRAPPPVYAQFNSEGTLDVPGTLLTIVKRFEKLEKWTVGHVRALEERMDDVERWLVEKEKDKDDPSSRRQGGGASGFEGVVNDMREEVAELSGRIGELGREMARIVASPANLSSGPRRSSASFGRAPSTNSMAVRSISTHIITSPTSTPPKVAQSTSPPSSAAAASSRASRTRLPYPTGDYATPPDSTMLNQGLFSPTSSPPGSVTSATKTRNLSISGMPSQPSRSDSMSPSGLPRSGSPQASSPTALYSSNEPGWRQLSVSPTPRKRYTVALGAPLTSADRAERDGSSIHIPSDSQELGTAYFSTSPRSATPANDAGEDSDTALRMNDETIGKSAARGGALGVPSDIHGAGATSQAVKPLKRTRPHSMYSPQTAQGLAAPSPVTPLNVRLRSRSTDRFGLGISDALGAPIPANSGKFVDPLVVRKQTKEALSVSVPPAPKVMPGKPKVPVNQLVAFFDQEKANK
ncbi:hypothetical protein OBBRIDRAFT_737562 [Obba rivulosa]|uniref:Uncharacterized protein n=1 Tax=Obba rivulosa TaxID=1052685 RepID=A0A8E2DH75_9APHY|nr:hypothetical protein OBBRIDRAFT_737562 [Obba rivulosa]